MKTWDNLSAQEIIDLLELSKLPVEGTYYKNTYVGEFESSVLGPSSTAMIGLYAEKPLSHSTFHKLKHDEIWHFYQGDPIILHLIYPDGKYQKVTLGEEISKMQFVVPKNVWQAGEITQGGNWAIFGCTMSPGFKGEDFTAGVRQELLNLAPDQASVINRLAHDQSQQLPEGFTQ